MACRMAKIEFVESTILTQTLKSVSLSFLSPPFYNIFMHSDHQCADNTEFIIIVYVGKVGHKILHEQQQIP